MIYKAKTSFIGYKIGLENPNVYIAAPKKYFKGGELVVEGPGGIQRVHEKDIVKEITLPDKIKPGTDYILAYLLWERK